MYLIGLLTEKL